MDPPDPKRELFEQALAVPEQDRAAFVHAHAPNKAIAEAVLGLLAHHAAAASGFMTGPAAVLPRAGPPSKIAEFEILRAVGQGGMGVVYEAYDTILKRRVGLKVLAPHLVGSEQAIARLRQEARAVAQLQHPNIVVVHRCDEDSGLHYVVMEFVEGQTLAQRLEEEREATAFGSRVQPGERARLDSIVPIIEAVASALEHAHRHGVTHRDVKPSNILLGADGQAKLTDFGIARIATEPTVTSWGTLAGTAPYMSPEQATASAQRVDHRTDIYSLGVVMYECLAHRLPYKGETVQQVLDAIRTTDPPRLRTVNPSIPRDLETICHKAMEKAPISRYQTASQVAADLTCWRRGDPILATPPSIGRRARRWAVRRRKPIAAVLAALLVAAVASFAWIAEARRRAQLCELSVTSPEVGAQVELYQVGPLDQPTSLIRQGATPLHVRVPIGAYRIIAKGAGDSFAETLALVLDPDAPVAIELPIRPHASITADMVLIEAGEHRLGDATREGPQAARTVALPGFFIDAHEVSNRQYLEFVQATGREMPLHWKEFGYDPAFSDLPVVVVTWEDAQAYARWAGKRLPTAEEWEAAMRAPDGRALPWGASEPSGLPIASLEERERFESSDLATRYAEYKASAQPVDSRPELATPLGLRHGATNVQEYTASVRLGPTAQVVVKGACWLNVPRYADSARVATRPLGTIDSTTGELVWASSMTVGFRCARSATRPKGD